MGFSRLPVAVRIALLYAVLSAVWILVSDSLLNLFVNDPGWHALIATIKGWGFILVSALLLYTILKRAFIERERLIREIEAHARHEEAISLLRQRALSRPDLDTLLNDAAMLVSLTLEMEYSSVLELVPAGDMLVQHTGVGWHNNSEHSSPMPVTEGTLAAYTLQSATPILIEDLRREQRFIQDARLSSHGVVSGMTMHIPGREQPFGMLEIYTDHSRTYTVDEQHFLCAVSNVLATAIGYARAEAELKRQKTLLECQSEASPDGIMLVSPDGQILSYNQRIINMWRIAPDLMAKGSRQQVLQSVMPQLRHPQEVVENINLLYQDRYAKSRDEVLFTDGRVFDRYTAPVEDAAGNYYGRVWYYRDMTNIRQTEAELRRQKTLLECQSEASLDGILVVDDRERIVSYNQRFVEIWHIPRDLLTNGSGDAALNYVLDMVNDAQEFVAKIRLLYEHRHERSHDEVYLKDGRVFDRYTAAVQDETGNYYGRVWYYRDITDIRQAQEALRANEEMLRTLVGSIDDIIFTLDTQQRHTGIFGRWIERYGLTPDFFLGKTSREISSNDETAKIHEDANARALAGEYVVYEWSTDVPTSHFQTSLSPMRNAHGAIIGLVGVGRDITALQQAEEATRRNAANFRTLAETTAAVTMIFDGDQVLYVNAAAEAVTGYVREELLRMRPESIISPESYTTVAENVQALLNNAGDLHMQYETRIITRTGQTRWLDVTASTIEFEGQAAGLVTAFDITERKHTAQELQRRHAELHALNMIIEAVNTRLELPDILASLSQLLAEQLHIAAGGIFLYHEADDQLSLETTWGMPAAMAEALSLLPVATAHNRQVVREQIPVRFCGFNEPDVPLHLKLQAMPTDWRCLLSVPLLAHGDIQGVLDMFSVRSGVLDETHIPFYATLGQQVGSAIQNARLFHEVVVGRERMQTLSRRLVEVQERERRTIARELHDEVGQILTGLNLSLELITRLPVEQVPARLDQARELVNELMSRVREMSLELRPPMLDDLGLLSALFWHFERYTAQTNIEVLFKHTGVERRFASDIEIAVYRMIQEAMTNVARYANVREVEVRLWASQDVLGVQVEDRGCGFDPQIALDSHASSGLSGMRERTRLLGGELIIESTPEQGSCLVVELPLITRTSTEGYIDE